MRKLIPIKENVNIGFHYTVTAEQIAEHQKRTLAEIFEWLENTNKFVHSLQTVSERENSRKSKNSL